MVANSNVHDIAGYDLVNTLIEMINSNYDGHDCDCRS